MWVSGLLGKGENGRSREVGSRKAGFQKRNWRTDITDGVRLTLVLGISAQELCCVASRVTQEFTLSNLIMSEFQLRATIKVVEIEVL